LQKKDDYLIEETIIALKKYLPGFLKEVNIFKY